MTRSYLWGILLAASALPVTALADPPAPPPVYEQQLSPRDIHNVQDRLRTLGFYQGNIDENWGPGTQGALQRFQENRGLQVTGTLNPATLTALGLSPNDLIAEATGSTIVPPPAPAPLTPAIVRVIQYRLGRLGFYRGNVDGVWGNGSQIALERFQQAQGLPVGQMTTDTMVAMGLDPANPIAEGSSSYRR